MNPIYKILVSLVLVFGLIRPGMTQDVENLLLKNYRPQSIYKVPLTKIERAKFPAIDMHTHVYAKTKEELASWISMMDKYGIEKAIILTHATGAKFDSLYQVYSKYGDRFQLWCGFDYKGYTTPGWSERAVKELERCYRLGAKGVGEIGDKGPGLWYSYPESAPGLHIDDARMQPLIRKCGELKMPINVHVAEPMWMYERMDSTNDGLMNAYEWRIPKHDDSSTQRESNVKRLSHSELIQTLENVVRENPKTTFIACHLANCEYDLSILGRLLTKYPNLYADIAARYAETATIPRYMNAFIQKYQDRIMYGSDMHFDAFMYETTFRILQTEDEHFYAIDLTGYHWPLHGFGLSDEVLKKVYNTNAKKILLR